MKKLTLAAVPIAALAAAGAAVAHGIDGGTQNVASVAGTFTATTTTGSTTQSCTTSAGKTIASTKATYTGTASGSPDLAGPAVIAARSTIDTTDGIGVVNGTLKVAGKTDAHFTAVYDHGTIAGTASGHVGTPHAQLLANVSATFSTAAGFTNGKIGGGTAAGSAVELTPGACKKTPPPPRPGHDQAEATGTITAVSSTSITVGGLTCAVPASLTTKVTANFPSGARAEIRCALVSGVETLVRIEAKK
jgi:hypothetical protein